MIPNFPQFKELQWEDCEEVMHFTSCFQPYSDFNFLSMWSWNTKEKMMLSSLNNNLVLLFYDYVSEMPFISFIGNNELSGTVTKLLEYSKQQFNLSTLKLVPEEVVKQLPDDCFRIIADPDSHDYIIPVEYLSKLDVIGKTHQGAKACQHFLELYPKHNVKCMSSADINKVEYIDFFKWWAKMKNLNYLELNEYIAFERFINNKHTVFHLIAIYHESDLIAFTTYEILSREYSICHFVKADFDYKGVYDALYFYLGKALNEKNVKYWNFEQDLGLPGLRQAKRKFKPEFYLKKFIVGENESPKQVSCSI